jgi:hypothetical protein
MSMQLVEPGGVAMYPGPQRQSKPPIRLLHAWFAVQLFKLALAHSSMSVHLAGPKAM